MAANMAPVRTEGAPALLDRDLDASLGRVGFDALPGWRADDAFEAFSAFRRTARHVIQCGAELRACRLPSKALTAAFRAAIEHEGDTIVDARAFFEANFTPWEIGRNQEAFFTGYFEPEFEGSMERTSRFQVPILRRPRDLVTLAQGDRAPNCDLPLTSAISNGNRLLPCPDRAAIEAGAFGAQGLELVWLEDRAAVFIVQVQGSARVLLPDGTTIRLRYAGRNGWPYTSIGRLLIARGAIAAQTMSLEGLMGWLRAHPTEGEALMRENRSYVFFERADSLEPSDGPIGGAGVSLTAGRSIAIDRGIWSYGLPFFIDVERPTRTASSGRWRRLMIAQDTGSAIVGGARVDIFFGAGAADGTLAGLQRHHGRLFVLLPRSLEH
jgi:membrane-bound lytic murein transglycosylase A